MKSTEKLATFLSSAAKGKIPELPRGLVTALRLILATRKSLVKELLAAKPEDIDGALIEIAKLSLRMRSDDAPENFEIVEFLEDRPEVATERVAAGS